MALLKGIVSQELVVFQQEVMKLKLIISSGLFSGIPREELFIVSIEDEGFHSWHFINSFHRLTYTRGEGAYS